MNKILPASIFLVSFLVSFTFSEFTALDCKELGFIKSQLLCSSCDNLKEFGLEEIKQQCIECCQKESASSGARRFPKAVLEVCTCKFGTYPQIQAFVKSERPNKFKNLQIKYLRGLDPQIKLYDDKETLVETLSITKWNTDTIEEFFQTHLENEEEPEYLKTNKI